MEPTYTMKDLVRLSDLPARRIRYYVQHALLPATTAIGSGPGYHDGHLARLRLIRRLQIEHLPLSVIRLRLESLSDAEVIAMTSGSAAVPDGAALANRVSEPSPGYWDAPPPPRSGQQFGRRTPAWEGGRNSSTMATLRAATSGGSDGAEAPSRSGEGNGSVDGPAARTREPWERIALTADVELHVRRPQSREMNRRIARILVAADEILAGSKS